MEEFNGGPRLSRADIEELVADMYENGRTPMEYFGITWKDTETIMAKAQAEGIRWNATVVEYDEKSRYLDIKLEGVYEPHQVQISFVIDGKEHICQGYSEEESLICINAQDTPSQKDLPDLKGTMTLKSAQGNTKGE